MKGLKHYFAEETQRASGPVVGDRFAINIDEDCLLETHVVDMIEDGVVVAVDDQFMSIMESYGITTETVRRYGAVGTNSAQGYTLEQCDQDQDSDDELELIRGRAGVGENAANNDPLLAKAVDLAPVAPVDEAEYQGRDVDLNKPFYTPDGPKKRSVYVKDPSTGNIKKVNFGSKEMKIKKSNPDRRKSFRARHNCDNPGSKTSARYWSCKAW
jgi:hypothetical protein